MRNARFIAALVLCATPAAALTDFWELPPVRYSAVAASDPMSALAAALESDDLRLPPAGLDRLRWLLARLDIPEQSQMLVFSKTSLQNQLIGPRSPRALFFSLNSYVGWVPGGSIEVITQDPTLGPVYYVIDDKNDGSPRILRENSSCFSCHGTTRTENVPGVLVRSVFPAANGQPILRLGSHLVDHRTPIENRWGGYWVTGRSGLPHLGNQTFVEDQKPQPAASDMTDLSGKLDINRYPRPTSDIVALLVLEHQCRVHNLLTAATMRYQRACFLSRATNPEADPNQGAAGRLAATAADDIVAALLFRDEADLGEDIEGDEEYQTAFASSIPHTAGDESLADFRLYGRLLKNRCSYMVYSQAFAHLPEFVKNRVIDKLHIILETEEAVEGFAYLKSSERSRIARILAETLPAYAKH